MNQYLTGLSLAARCRYSLTYGGLCVNDAAPNHWAFVKADRLHLFLATEEARSCDVLFTGCSDYAILDYEPTGRGDRRVLDKFPFQWFAVSPVATHERLHSLAVGVMDDIYPCGDTATLDAVRAARRSKETLFYANYSICNNPAERGKCAQFTGIAPDDATRAIGATDPIAAFRQYLTNVSRAGFCFSPSGAAHGEAHRTWESLLVGTIPIVTASQTARDHAEWCPMVVLDDWSDFKASDFSMQRYDDLWGDFSSDSLMLVPYLRRLRDKWGLSGDALL